MRELYESSTAIIRKRRVPQNKLMQKDYRDRKEHKKRDKSKKPQRREGFKQGQ